VADAGAAALVGSADEIGSADASQAYSVGDDAAHSAQLPLQIPADGWQSHCRAAVSTHAAQFPVHLSASRRHSHPAAPARQVVQVPSHFAESRPQTKVVPNPAQEPQPVHTEGTAAQLQLVDEVCSQLAQSPLQSVGAAALSKLPPVPTHASQLPVQAAALGPQAPVAGSQKAQSPSHSASTKSQVPTWPGESQCVQLPLQARSQQTRSAQ
jgi:hypothetical protein